MAIAARSPVGLVQRERALRPDLFIVIPYVLLSGLGVLMIYSASARRLETLGVDPGASMKRQALFVVIGIVVFIVASMLETRFLRLVAPMLYVGSLAALILVLTGLGKFNQGSQRWIPIGPIQLQPSEIAKIAVILALAAVLTPGNEEGLRWHRVARAIALVAVPAYLIFRQPDLGTMLVFGFIAVVMLFVAGTTWRQLGFLVVTAVVGTVALFQLNVLKDYQVTRLQAFLDPTASLANANYNQAQSQIAIGSGGFLGKGVFNGTQTNLQFVPEQSTDFIFTAIGEQLGFVGGVVVLGLFAVLVWRLLMSAAVAGDRFGQLVAVGVAALLSFHVFVNVGMTVRLLPVTGLPLPFLSLGGTAFLVMSLALGLAHSVWMHRPPMPGERRGL